MTYFEIKEQLREDIVSVLDLSREFTDDEIAQIIDEHILRMSKERYINGENKLKLKQELFNSIRRLDLLQELLDNPQITEVMVNGTEGIFYEQDGRIYPWNKTFESMEKLEDVIQQIVARANRHVNEAYPIVDARLDDGSRVNVVLKPVALNGPILTIRKFPKEPVTMEKLIGWGAISEEAAEFLRVMVCAGYNILVSGGTGSGKTTLLNALADYIPKDERIVTIEDSAELQIQGIDNLVRLEARACNCEGELAVTIRDLVKSSLRMRPTRIIVGEVRGPEVIDMLQAMNTGHDGSLTTAHANTPEDMLSRLETMVLMGMDIPLAAVRSQISSAVDIIIQLGRLRDKSRRMLQITEVVGYDNDSYVLNPLFDFVEEGNTTAAMVNETGNYGEVTNSDKVVGKLIRTVNPLKNRRKLRPAALSIKEEI